MKKVKRYLKAGRNAIHSEGSGLKDTCQPLKFHWGPSMDFAETVVTYYIHMQSFVIEDNIGEGILPC